MNRGQLRALCRTSLNDPSPGVRWTDAELDGWLNEALDEWTLATNQLPTVAAPVASPDLPTTAFYTAPTDALAIVQVQYQGRELPRLVLPEWQNWESATGLPTRVILGPFGSLKFRLWPYQAADLSADLEVYYIKRPAQMASDADVPELPEIFQRALSHWATATALLRDSDTQSTGLATAYMEKFNALVVRAMDNQALEPLTVPMRWY